MHISAFNLLVEDYDEAIGWFCDKLQFSVVCDEPVAPGVRFVRLSPGDSTSMTVVLLKAASQAQKQTVGKQAGDAVLGYLNTDDFWTRYHQMRDAGVVFTEQPREEVYATVVVFEDLYGNKWDLLQPAF